MLSIGWPEMMVVAAAALIIIGPRDLPAMLRRLGQAVGSVRRMGNEFRAEINKVAALDDVKDIKKSMTLPFTEAQADINKEFNKITSTGVEPSGALKPKDPKAESVFDEIQDVVGKNAPKAKAKAKSAKASTAKSAAAKSAPAKAKTGKATPAVAKAPASKTPAKKPVQKAAAAKKPATRKAPAKTTTTKTATAKPARKPRTPKAS